MRGSQRRRCRSARLLLTCRLGRGKALAPSPQTGRGAERGPDGDCGGRLASLPRVPPQRGAASRQGGFTLIEMLAVLVVLALAIGVVTANFGARRDGEVLEAAAHELASRCRAARTAAIRGASDRTILIDMTRRVVTAGEDLPPLRIPDTVSIRSETSAGERRGPDIAGIRFFPNGGSTGGTIRLQTGQLAYEVRVNWLTGRVVVERLS